MTDYTGAPPADGAAAAVDVGMIGQDHSRLLLLTTMFRLSGYRVASLILPPGATTPAATAATTSFLTRSQPRLIVADLTSPYADTLACLLPALAAYGTAANAVIWITPERQAVMGAVGEIDLQEVTRDISQLTELGRLVRRRLTEPGHRPPA